MSEFSVPYFSDRILRTQKRKKKKKSIFVIYISSQNTPPAEIRGASYLHTEPMTMSEYTAVSFALPFPNRQF